MEIRIKKYVKIIYYILLIQGLFSIGLAYCEQWFWANKIYLLAMIEIFAVHAILFFLHNKGWGKKTSQQMLIAFFLLCLFWDCSLVHNQSLFINWKYFFVGFLAFHTAFVFWLYQYAKKINLYAVKLRITENRYIIVILLIFVFFSIIDINSVLRWDAVEYEAMASSNLKAFPYTLFNIQGYMFNHFSLGAAFFMAIGECLLPMNGVGIRCIQIIMAVITIIAATAIVKKFVTISSKGQSILITGIFAVSPLILGLVDYISLDFYSMCFFIWLIYSHIYQKYVWQVMCGLLLCFSKETAVIGYCVYLVSYYIVLVIKNIHGNFKKLKINNILKILSIEEWVVYWIPILFWVLIYFSNGLGVWTGGDGVSNSIEFNVPFILQKLRSVFIVNFNWLIYLILVISILYYLVKRKKNKIQITGNEYLIAMSVSYVVYVIFYCIFVTYNHIRYNQIFGVIPLIFMSIILLKAMKKKCFYIIMSCCLAVLLVQNFYTIDILSLISFNDFSLGNGRIMSTRTEEMHNEYIYSDSIVYNREYTYFDKNMYKFLEDIHYDGSQLIVLDNVSGQADITSYCILGFFEPIYYSAKGHTMGPYYNYYGSQIDYFDDSIILNLMFIDDSSENINFDAYSEVYYVDQDWGYNSDFDILEAYQCTLYKTYNYLSAKTTIYKLNEKDF